MIDTEIGTDYFAYTTIKNLKLKTNVILFSDNFGYIDKTNLSFNESLIWFLIKPICYKDKLYVYRFDNLSHGSCQLSIINKKIYIKTHMEKMQNISTKWLYDGLYIRLHSNNIHCNLKKIARKILNSFKDNNSKIIKFESKILEFYLKNEKKSTTYKEYLEKYSKLDEFLMNSIFFYTKL